MTRNEARTLAKRYADMENSSFVSDAEWNTYLDLAHADLYDMLVASYEDYFLKDPAPTYSLTSGENTISLPSDFYKLRGIDVNIGGRYVTLHPFQFEERNVYDRAVSRLGYGVRRLRYRVMGTKIRIVPEDDAAGTYRVWYIPRYTPLASGSDEYTGVLDWEEFIPQSAAIMAIQKEEGDPSVMMTVLGQTKKRIMDMSANRDSGEPQRISDSSLSLVNEDILNPL